MREREGGERERERGREGEREKGREKSAAFVCKMILKNYRNARRVYVASQKALFTAFIAIIKKVGRV